MDRVVSYSDGEGAAAGIGVGVWTQRSTVPHAAFCRVPEFLRKLWSTTSKNGNDIFLIEAVGPLIVLLTFPNLIRNKLWLHFIDNESAEYSLIKGSSSNSSGDYVVGLTWERVVRLSTIPFFSRVESAANPVDGLSRGKRNGPWKQVHEVQFPSQAIVDMAYECGDMAFKLRAEG